MFLSFLLAYTPFVFTPSFGSPYLMRSLEKWLLLLFLQNIVIKSLVIPPGDRMVIACWLNVGIQKTMRGFPGPTSGTK